jgi:peptidoglycan/LPS O-acetylase OafA/YrhL
MPDKQSSAGCLWTMLALNGVLIGLVALSFSQGPYSSDEQEYWYRYKAIGFFIAGVILPALAACFGVSKSQKANVVLTVWMIAVFVAFANYVFVSGGGV